MKNLVDCPLCKGKGKIVDQRHYPANVRKKARAMFAKGITLREIGKTIGVEHPQKVKSLIMSKTL
jgi:hypothetical protein